MTTVVGMYDKDLQMAFLASDRQGTVQRDGTPVGKVQWRKLFVADDQRYVIGHTGLMDDQTQGLVKRVTSGEIDIQRIISEGKFSDLREMNLDKMGDKLPDPGNMSSFLLASRFDDKPALYTCFPLGSVEERDVTWVGSGSQRVQQYFQALSTLSDARDYLPNGENTREGMLRVGLEATRFAQEGDIYSSGLDMVVLTPEGLTDHRDDLTPNFPRQMRRIQKAHRQPKDTGKK